jgi:hypothetical protein
VTGRPTSDLAAITATRRSSKCQLTTFVLNTQDALVTAFLCGDDDDKTTPTIPQTQPDATSREAILMTGTDITATAIGVRPALRHERPTNFFLMRDPHLTHVCHFYIPCGEMREV